MSVTKMSYFRLFGLPLDLLELLTLYFEGKEAVKLLTVSSNFHEIFARSVWHTITVNTIRVPEPTRSSVFARYGHLVRSINLFNKLNSEFHLHNWAQLFPNTTSMAFEITPRMEDGDKQMLMDTIASLHGLRSLKIQMKINQLPFDLETLATVLVVRQHDPSKQSLRELIMFFGLKEDREEQDDDAEEISWFRLSSFVQALSPLRPLIKLQIDMRGYPDLAAPTPAQMDILRPHLSGIPAFSEIEAQDGCKALRNRQLFSPSGTRDDPLVFGQLDTLRLRVCCASSHLFDYSDFTQAKFPVMDSMVITGNECSHQFEDGVRSAINTLVLQEWPKLKDLKVVDSGLTLSTVDELIELNPQLATLVIGIHRNINDVEGVFMLERVTGRLPHLTRFSLIGNTSIPVDSDWLQATSLVDIRSSKLRFVSINMSMLSHRLFETLLALPRLHSMGFWYCVLDEPELVMNVFKRHRQIAKKDATVGVRRLAIGIPRINNNWSTELVLEMVDSLTRLESCRIYDDDALKSAIQEKHPKLF